VARPLCCCAVPHVDCFQQTCKMINRCHSIVCVRPNVSSLLGASSKLGQEPGLIVQGQWAAARSAMCCAVKWCGKSGKCPPTVQSLWRPRPPELRLLSRNQTLSFRPHTHSQSPQPDKFQSLSQPIGNQNWPARSAPFDATVCSVWNWQKRDGQKVAHSQKLIKLPAKKC